MTLTSTPTLYAISDFRDGWPPAPTRTYADYLSEWQAHDSPVHLPSDLAAARAATRVEGGYMERLPLACIKAGLVDYAEKWHYDRTNRRDQYGLEQPLFGYRTFHIDANDAQPDHAPFHSDDLCAFIAAHGAPHILCVWGLGVDERILDTCAESFKIYYSIDAPPLRMPPDISRHFNLILVGEEWQRSEVRARHPTMPCEILTIGPEFADDQTFQPLGLTKEYDLIYVACAQPYKRHDVLFEAMARCRRPVNCLCVIGYGDLTEALHMQAQQLGIAVDFIDPPGVSFEQVNYHINRARIGIVAGVNDGCPAILTEYMLAGLPVLINAELCCGQRFITPETGVAASADAFSQAIETLLDTVTSYQPRDYAIAHWGWASSVRQLECAMRAAGYQSAR